jgi:putative effector of murein hydrolase LrgA (UPF0299 family)
MENEDLLENPSTGASLPSAIIAATPFFMGIAALKFKSGDMEAMGKNLGGSVMLFLVPKIVEVIITWAAK